MDAVMYPPGRPLVFGARDGIVRPAVMIAFAHGARIGTRVWVEGTGVDAEVGHLIELVEGEVIIRPDPEYGFPNQGTTAVDAIAAKGVPVAAAAALAQPAGADPPLSVGAAMVEDVPTATDPAPTPPMSVAAVVGGGFTRDRLEQLSFAELKSTAASMGVTVIGRMSKESFIKGLLARYG
jgi:hypothetical protein